MPIKLGEEIASGQKVYYISSNRRIQYSNCIVLDLNLDFGKIKEMISKDRLKAICQLKSAYLLDEKQIENEVSLYEHEILGKMDFIKQLIQEG